MVEVVEGGEEGALLELGPMEVLLFERLLAKPPLGIPLARGVLALALASAEGVLVLSSVLLALFGAGGDEVVGVAVVEADLLASTGSCGCCETMQTDWPQAPTPRPQETQHAPLK